MKAATTRREMVNPCLWIATLCAIASMLAACAAAPPTPSVTAPPTPSATALPTPSAKLSKERIAEILTSADRSDADRTNDIRRKPDQI